MKFFVGIGRFHLDMACCSSLKDKRRYMKSIVDRLGRSRATGACEVGTDGYWKSGTLAVACVSSSREVVASTLDHALKTIENCGVEVVQSQRLIIKPEDLEGIL